MSHVFDPSLISINSTWPGLIADLSVSANDFRIEANTRSDSPYVRGNGEWIQIDGSSSVGTFTLFLPGSLCVSLLKAADHELELEALDGTSAALILEHFVGQRLAQLEEVLGCDLVLSAVSDVEVDVTQRLLGLELVHAGQTYEAALHVAGQLMEDLERVVNQNANMEEKQLSGVMSVQLGPVVVSKRAAYLARRGEIIDCGVVPSDVIKGVLMRSDGRYWPIHIEDHSVEIAGPLSGPVSFETASPDHVYVTFGIGEANLTPLQRTQADIGTRVEVDRYANDEARVFYQAQPFAIGNLSLNGENLAVTLQTIGAFSE